MREALTAEERYLLEGLVDDGFPLVVYAAHLDDDGLARLMNLATGLLNRGLVSVYGLPYARDLAQPEAEAILSDPKSWRESAWMVETTPAGEAALEGHS